MVPDVTMTLQHLSSATIPLRRACLDSCQVKVAMFADDTVLLAQEEEDLRWNVEKLNQAIKRRKIKVNRSKTNTMVFSRVPSECNVAADGEIEEC